MDSGGQPTASREVVYLYNHQGELDTELHYLDFQGLVNGSHTLPKFAASNVRAAYCVVGNQLALVGVVFFTLTIREDGSVEEGFNLPLQYLVKQAGLVDYYGGAKPIVKKSASSNAPLAAGHKRATSESVGTEKARERQPQKIRQASRSQCPVPWHAIHMWEPKDGAEIAHLQRRIRQNRLGLPLNIVSAFDVLFDAADAGDYADFESNELSDTTNFSVDSMFSVDVSEPSSTSHQIRRSNESDIIHAPVSKALISKRDSANANPGAREHAKDTVVGGERSYANKAQQKLNEVFGEAGKLSLQELVRLHAEQPEKLKAEFRQQRKHQRNAHLSQMHDAHAEIQKLRIALQQEQSRSSRLQEMLRGDI